MNNTSNPQAFPHAKRDCNGQTDYTKGMTLRDYFANDYEPEQYEIDLERSRDRNKDPHNEKDLIRSQLEIICYLKFKYAGAMLIERSKHD